MTAAANVAIIDESPGSVGFVLIGQMLRAGVLALDAGSECGVLETYTMSSPQWLR